MEKIKVLLACAGGMSTTMLVKKIIDAGADKGYEVECNAYAVNAIKEVGKDANCILLGPQAGFMVNKVKTDLPGVPVAVISYQDYGMMNGVNAFKLALDTIAATKK